jgi:hypothetical protein
MLCAGSAGRTVEQVTHGPGESVAPVGEAGELIQ